MRLRLCSSEAFISFSTKFSLKYILSGDYLLAGKNANSKMLAALRSRQQEVFKRQKSDRLTRLCRARSSVAEARIGDHCARENIAGTVADFECAVS